MVGALGIIIDSHPKGRPRAELHAKSKLNGGKNGKLF